MESKYSENRILKIVKKTNEKKHITDLRLLHLKKYLSLSLPSIKSESWRYTDASLFDPEKFQNSDSGTKIELIGMHEVLKQKGVIFMDLKTAIKEHPEKVYEYLSKNDEKSPDKFYELHHAMWKDGIFIYVPKNIEVDVILKSNINTNKEGSHFNHTLIVLEEGARLTYSEEHTDSGLQEKTFRCDYVQVQLDNNSELNFNSLQTWSDKVSNVTFWKANSKNDSQIHWRSAIFGGKSSRTKIDTHFDGAGSHSTNKGIIFGNEDQVFDITTNAHHHTNDTTSDVLVKGVFDGKCRGVYRGLINIDYEGKKTSSYLSNHSLMLSGDAKSNTIPSLIIETDDVKASHGATLKKIDKEHMFYLKSRGISQKDSENLLIEAFLMEAVDDIKDEDMKQKIKKIIASKRDKQNEHK